MKKNKARGLKGMLGSILRHTDNERGIVLTVAIMVMGLMAVLGAAIISTSTTDVQIARNVTRSRQALAVAEAGVSQAINYIRSDPGWGPDLDKDGYTSDDATAWASQSQGTIQLGSLTGSYTIDVYDATGSYGRLNNSTRSDRYTNLGSDDVLLEVTGTVGGATRKIGLVVRNSITAFDYATYSDGTIDGNGAGSNPGKFVGKIFGKSQIQLQGNYDLTEATAESPGTITPNCSSGKFKSCNDSAQNVTPPVLDFSYYQDQSNFSTQQVFTMTPTVGSTSSCGSNCTQWPINYEITTGGNTYTVIATAQAVKSGKNYNHTIYWCTDPAWDGNISSCSGTLNSYSFVSQKVESSKPFIDAYQFNHYTQPTNPNYTSSIVNVFDAAKHLEFLGPQNPGDSVTVTATILVGTAADNSAPAGKIDIEGGAGTLNFVPANGLAIVSEKVEFKAKYSSINVTVGTAVDGAVIIASNEFEVEADSKSGYTADFTMNGSVVVGDGTSTGDLEIGGNGVTANFNYVTVNNLPQGWQDYGTQTIARREWREL